MVKPMRILFLALILALGSAGAEQEKRKPGPKKSDNGQGLVYNESLRESVKTAPKKGPADRQVVNSKEYTDEWSTAVRTKKKAAAKARKK
jgi:hypothetical protein